MDCGGRLPASAAWLGGPLLALGLLRALGAPVFPPLATWALCVALAPLASASLWVMLASGVAGLVVGARWMDEGSRLALVLSGRRPVHVLRALWPVLLVVLVVGAGASMLVEPGASRFALRTWSASQPQLHLWPGARVQAGGLGLVVDDEDAGRVWLHGPDWVGSSPDAAVHGAVLELHDLSLLSVESTPVALSAARVRIPLEVPSVRVPLHARGALELVDVARRTQAAGRDASYEWSVLYKRLWCGPSAALWLWLGWLLGAQRWRWASWAGLVLSWLVVVRLGDGVVFSVGPLLGSAAGPLWLTLAAAVLWRRSVFP